MATTKIPSETPTPLPKRSRHSKQLDQPGRQLTLLLVDDDIDVLNLCAAALEMSGASVLTAASPADALSIMAQRAANDAGVDVAVVDYRLAVVDYRLPAMNGCVLADFLRALHPDLKIILYSGESGIPEGEMSSVDAFVPKGSGVQSLLEQVSQLTDVGLYEVRNFTNSS